MAEPRTHPQVEYAVDDASGKERIFKDFDSAAGFAVAVALSGREHVNLDVLVWGEEGAAFVGLEEAYAEDPEASVTQRLVISAASAGRVP